MPLFIIVLVVVLCYCWHTRIVPPVKAPKERKQKRMSNAPQCKHEGCKNKQTYSAMPAEIKGKPLKVYSGYCILHRPR